MNSNTHGRRTFGLMLACGLWLWLGLAAWPALAQAPVTGGVVAGAKNGEVRVFMSNGLRIPFEAVRTQAEAAVGRRIAAEYGASRRMTPQIEAGVPFELTIMTKEVVEEMVAKGKVTPGLIDLARVPVAVAQRGGSSGDVSTPASLKALLLGAKVIHFTGIGASRPTVDNTFAKLGIEEAVKGKLDPSSSSQGVASALGTGEYDLILNLSSEFTDVPGWTYLGALPAQLQVPVIMSAGVGASGDASAARTLVKFLQGPTIDGPLKASRMGR